jgi:catechol 2,3-dioxygenase-like lactoylglutathione lyase family enzyme
VRDIEALHADLSARGVRFRSSGPVEMTGGANRGGKSLYALDPDGYIFEFHERPPRVAA